MSEEKSLPFSFAVIADIHGNSWALEAVLKDIDRRGIQAIMNLGDCLTGPLDPARTADLLMERDILSVSGNDDRILFAPVGASLSQKYTLEHVNQDHLNWLRRLPLTAELEDQLFICHGDQFSVPYLLEEVEDEGVFLRNTRDIEIILSKITQPVILSGHSHVPRTVYLPQGKLAMNPGSVGLPAYTDETPIPHAMESGSPHARYALLLKVQNKWQVEHIQVPYDWEHAASVASGNQRPDWAEWLASGRAQ
jgi:putative phosphoesterase